MGQRDRTDRINAMRRRSDNWRRAHRTWSVWCGCVHCQRQTGVTEPAPYDRAAEKRIAWTEERPFSWGK